MPDNEKALACEMTRAMLFASGSELDQIQEMEKMLYGKTLEDYEAEGHSVGTVVIDHEGQKWSARGRFGL